MKKLLVVLFTLVGLQTGLATGLHYYVDYTGGSDDSTGLSEVKAWKTVSKVTNSSFGKADTISFKYGEEWRQDELQFWTDEGSADSLITVNAYGDSSDGKPVLSGAILGNPSTTYEWILSDSGTTVYYIQLTGGGDPSIDDPGQVWVDTTACVSDTLLGDMDVNDFDYCDKDGLGFSTVYLKLDSGDPDTSGVVIDIEDEAIGCRIGGGYIELYDLEFRLFGDASWGANVMVFTGGHHITFYDCLMREGTSAELVKVYGSAGSTRYIEFNRCVITGNRRQVDYWGSLVKFEEANHNTLYECDLSEACDGDHPDGLFIYKSDSNTVKYCDFLGPFGNGIYMQWGADYNEIAYNVVRHANSDVGATGIQIRAAQPLNSCNYNSVHHNLLYDLEGPAIQTHGDWAENIGNSICNNTIFMPDSIGNGISVIDSNRAAVIKNNIVHCDHSAWTMRVDPLSIPEVDISNNCFFTNKSYYPVVYYNSTGYLMSEFGDYQTASGDNTSINDYAAFRDTSSYNYRLSAESPCIDTGVYIEGITETDIEGTSVNSTTVDMGCYEAYWPPIPSTDIPRVAIATNFVLRSRRIEVTLSSSEEDSVSDVIEDNIGWACGGITGHSPVFPPNLDSFIPDCDLVPGNTPVDCYYDLPYPQVATGGDYDPANPTLYSNPDGVSFNWKITRITRSGYDYPEYKGAWTFNPEVCYWNYSGSMFVAHDWDSDASFSNKNSRWLFDSNGKRLRKLHLTDPLKNYNFLEESFRWAKAGYYVDGGTQNFENDSTFYFIDTSGVQIIKLDNSADGLDTLKTWSWAGYTDYGNAGKEGDLDYAGQYLMVDATRTGDGDRVCFAVDVINGTKGTDSNFSHELEDDMDYARMSPSGDYIIVVWGTSYADNDDTSIEHGIEIYNRSDFSLVRMGAVGVVHNEVFMDANDDEWIITACTKPQHNTQIWARHDETLELGDIVKWLVDSDTTMTWNSDSLVNARVVPLFKLRGGSDDYYLRVQYGTTSCDVNPNYFYLSTAKYGTLGWSYPPQGGSYRWWTCQGEFIKIPTSGSAWSAKTAKRLFHNRSRRTLYDGVNYLSEKGAQPDFNVNRQGTKGIICTTMGQQARDLFLFELQ